MQSTQVAACSLLVPKALPLVVEGHVMNLKTKNWLTATVLGLLAFSFYLFAMPSVVIEQIAKAIRAVFNG